jgi:hypothetical protein
VSDDDFELGRLHVVYISTADGGHRQAFAIDGRDYDDAAAMRRDLDEAWDELSRRRIAAEFETRPVEGQSRMTWLPTWSEYRATIGGDGG